MSKVPNWKSQRLHEGTLIKKGAGAVPSSTDILYRGHFNFNSYPFDIGYSMVI